MLHSIDFIVNYNQYESKRVFTQMMARSFQRFGVAVRVIDVQETPLNNSYILAQMQGVCDATCSFNALLPLANGEYLWEVTGTPHIAFLVDPAIYSLSLAKSENVILTCVDKNDVEFLKSRTSSPVFFMPHATFEEQKADVNAERPYDIVFIGSCYDYEGLREFWMKQLSPMYSQALEYAIEILQKENDLPFFNALLLAWRQLYPQEPLNDEDWHALAYYLDYYIRGKERVDLIRSINCAQVHIFGELATDHVSAVKGWDYYLKDKSNVTIHPSLLFRESLHILQQAKVCLNSMPFFKNGTHERIFNGMAAGALVVTNENSYYREFFTHNQEVLFFNNNNISDIDSIINPYLTNNEQRKLVAIQGQDKTLLNHTFDQRAKQLLTHLTQLIVKQDM